MSLQYQHTQVVSCADINYFFAFPYCKTCGSTRPGGPPSAAAWEAPLVRQALARLLRRSRHPRARPRPTACSAPAPAPRSQCEGLNHDTARSPSPAARTLAPQHGVARRIHRPTALPSAGSTSQPPRLVWRLVCGRGPPAAPAAADPAAAACVTAALLHAARPAGRPGPLPCLFTPAVVQAIVPFPVSSPPPSALSRRYS